MSGGGTTGGGSVGGAGGVGCSGNGGVGSVGNGGAVRPPPQVQGPGSSGPQRYPSPIQRPTNYSQAPVPVLQHQQRSNRQAPGHGQQGNAQQPGGGGNMGQGLNNANKHYYGGNRG